MYTFSLMQHCNVFTFNFKILCADLYFGYFMAALSIGPSFHTKHSTTQEHRKTRSSPRILILLCCQSHKPVDTSKPRLKKESKWKSLLPPSFVGFEKFGKILQENLSPKQKGDWNDVMLMSLSFAIYVYISQRIVCAYCAWTYMPKQPWSTF